MTLKLVLSNSALLVIESGISSFYLDWWPLNFPPELLICLYFTFNHNRLESIRCICVVLHDSDEDRDSCDFL